MEYWSTIVAIAGINMILALSVYSSFMTGTVSLGQIAFFAIGGFSSASLTTILGWHILPALLVGAVVAAVGGALIAIPMLRLRRGFHLTIATVAVVEVVRVVFHNMQYGREGEFVLAEGAEMKPWIGPQGPLGFRHISYLTDNDITPLEFALWVSLAVVLICLEGLYHEVAAAVLPDSEVRAVVTTSELDFLDQELPSALAGIERNRPAAPHDLLELAEANAKLEAVMNIERNIGPTGKETFP